VDRTLQQIVGQRCVHLAMKSVSQGAHLMLACLSMQIVTHRIAPDVEDKHPYDLSDTSQADDDLKTDTKASDHLPSPQADTNSQGLIHQPDVKASLVETGLQECNGPQDCWTWRRLTSDGHLARASLLGNNSGASPWPADGVCKSYWITDVPIGGGDFGLENLCCCIRGPNGMHSQDSMQWEARNRADGNAAGIDMWLTSPGFRSTDLYLGHNYACVWQSMPYQKWFQGHIKCFTPTGTWMN